MSSTWWSMAFLLSDRRCWSRRSLTSGRGHESLYNLLCILFLYTCLVLITTSFNTSGLVGVSRIIIYDRWTFSRVKSGQGCMAIIHCVLMACILILIYCSSYAAQSRMVLGLATNLNSLFPYVETILVYCDPLKTSTLISRITASPTRQRY